MADGTVMSFNQKNGSAFIQPDDGAKPILVHSATLRAAGVDHLVEGQRVSFNLQSASWQRVNVVGFILKQ